MRKRILLLLVLAACRGEKPAVHPPVILISIDTLRSDHLPAYGYRSIRTPNIDSLADDGIVFEHAFSNVPLTLPSHTSIFTGLLPAHHGVRDNAGFVLDPATPTIASLLHAQGYATGGAVSAWVLRGSTHAGTGFDTWDDAIPFIEGAPTGNLSRDGGETVNLLTGWIAGHAQQPFLAFAHFFEPHAPYQPSYDADIVTADRHVGTLLQSLRAGGLYDDALIILLSDHGEGLRDHGEQEHGVLLYREALQVPLVVKLPRNERRGTRVARTVQLIDVLPTIAAVTGAALPKVDGHSLLEDGPTDRPVFSETLYPRIHLGWSDLRSVVHWPHHLIDGPHPELYDLTRDPTEARDLRESDRRAYARLRSDLAAAPSTDAAAPRVDPEEAKKLAALGYLTAQQGGGKSTLNPRDHLADLDALREVSTLLSAGRFPEAAQRIEGLLARNPGWSDLRDDLGVAYEQMGDLPRAEKAYREAIAATPELAPDFALSLAGVLLERNALDDAEAHARLALKTNPDGAHALLARIALARRNADDALREAQLSHDDFLLAAVFMTREDPRSALAALRRVNDASRTRHTPLPRGFYLVTGDALLRLGRTEDAREAYLRAIQVHPEDRVARERLERMDATH